MKYLIALLLFISFDVLAKFIHPMDFNQDTQKEEIVKIIKERVRHDYCDSGLDMCQETTLRMMERQNLEAFKKATKATNRKIMDRVIKDYCNNTLDMCNYTTIWMMYNQNLEASQSSLEW